MRTICADLEINAELNFLFVTDPVIHRYNKQYLRHDYATDVLAFPCFPHPLSRSGRGDGGEGGDIMISTDTAACQAKEQGHSFERELLILMIHGLLHLLGYRDKKKSEAKRMWRKTEQLLKKVKK